MMNDKDEYRKGFIAGIKYLADMNECNFDEFKDEIWEENHCEIIINTEVEKC